MAVADIDEERLATFGEAWDVDPDDRYVGHEAMLAAEDLDVVSVCTPSFLHHEHVIDAAQSAAAPEVIWCEKPIASQVSAAEEPIHDGGHCFQCKHNQLDIFGEGSTSLTAEAEVFDQVGRSADPLFVCAL